MRYLPIELSELEVAFEDNSYLISNYLDIETGEVFFVSDEHRGLLEGLYEEYYDEENQSVDWEKGFAEMNLPDWQHSLLKELDMIESGYGTRFIKIPPEGSHEGYRDMEAFISTLPNPRLQVRLEQAISGSGAFRKFKDVLLNYPAERERWFQFKRERLQSRILEWLKTYDIAPLPEQDETSHPL